MKVKHCDFSDSKCPCGYSFPNKSKLQTHQEGCVLSKKGATVAIKRASLRRCVPAQRTGMPLVHKRSHIFGQRPRYDWGAGATIVACASLARTTSNGTFAK